MNKRQFVTNSIALLAGTAGMATRPVFSATNKSSGAEVIFTVTGMIERSNRGKFDPVSDQLMHKQGIHFDRAYQFTLADLLKLPAATIHPTVEYDQRVHALKGPRMVDVLSVAGISQTAESKIILHGIDGYSPEIELDRAKQYNFILATHFDDKPLHIGGFGPLFAIYDADRIPEFAQMPLAQRFALCPWGLYCIEVA